ncbi:hypothetical protein RADP37_05026 [Roseomonas mucosa]|uniref:Uncharacterized protein n=1 Tax=Roseomonas mucosa TaxID=207340 RepID=A0A4Y1N3D8_9PROT|nr:hypothetical protein RADP37_05026 [Roseomonas mucosa]
MNLASWSRARRPASPRSRSGASARGRRRNLGRAFRSGGDRACDNQEALALVLVHGGNQALQLRLEVVVRRLHVLCPSSVLEPETSLSA